MPKNFDIDLIGLKLHEEDCADRAALYIEQPTRLRDPVDPDEVDFDNCQLAIRYPRKY